MRRGDLGGTGSSSKFSSSSHLQTACTPMSCSHNLTGNTNAYLNSSFRSKMINTRNRHIYLYAHAHARNSGWRLLSVVPSFPREVWYCLQPASKLSERAPLFMNRHARKRYKHNIGSISVPMMWDVDGAGALVSAQTVFRLFLAVSTPCSLWVCCTAASSCLSTR